MDPRIKGFFGAVVITAFIVVISLLIAAACAPASDELPGMIVNSENSKTILYREIDEQAGVVCYGWADVYIRPGTGGGISCLLIKDTNLIARPSTSQSGSQ